jgi:predicted dehydrogenase
LDQSGARAVYVSTHNAGHAALVMAALDRGKHVAVDKPAFTNLEDARRAVDLAASKGVVLAEANVWSLHPRVEAARRLFSESGGASRLQASFSFPPFALGNYRLERKLGGGALLDLGPYAISPGRVFFGLAPEHTECRILSRSANQESGVDTAFACMMTYPGGCAFTGVFGFDTGYVNTLQIQGPGMSACLDRAFTPPPDARFALDANTPGGGVRLEIEPADTFALFFARFSRAIRTGEGGDLARELVEDAIVLGALSASASAGQAGPLP